MPTWHKLPPILNDLLIIVGQHPGPAALAEAPLANDLMVKSKARHRDRPGVLAHVFDQLRRADLNVQETENIVFEGAEAAVARVNLDGPPPDDACQLIRQNADVLDLQVVTL